jgi:hypothetical protein
VAQTLTFRQEAAQASARIIFYGTVEKTELKGTGGVSQIRIEAVLRNDPFLGGRKVIEVPRYLPILDPKDLPRYLVFCDIFKDQLDPYRGVPVKSAAVAEYLKGALALDPKDRTRTLLYYFNYLEDPDKKIAEDAFLEFAKANDQEIGQVGPKLSAAKLRGWIKDPQLPAQRLGLYSYLLGACGGPEDAILLRTFLQKPTENTLIAYDGMLSGYIHLRPQEGWDLAFNLLRDSQQPFRLREAALRTLRFYHGSKPDDTRIQVLRGLAALLPQGDIADLAIGDLIRWQMWDLTNDVLALYGKKSHDAPLMRRTILRYALSCPKPEASRFLTERRKQDPEAVRDVEESLQYDKAPTQ